MCGWMGGWCWKGGWVFFWERGWQQRALWYPLHLLSVLMWLCLCVVYVHRIGSALHSNKILLLIICSAQKSANQSDEDNKAGWVARAPWVPKSMFIIWWINVLELGARPTLLLCALQTSRGWRSVSLAWLYPSSCSAGSLACWAAVRSMIWCSMSLDFSSSWEVKPFFFLHK